AKDAICRRRALALSRTRKAGNAEVVCVRREGFAPMPHPDKSPQRGTKGGRPAARRPLRPWAGSRSARSAWAAAPAPAASEAATAPAASENGPARSASEDGPAPAAWADAGARREVTKGRGRPGRAAGPPHALAKSFASHSPQS